VRDAGHDVVTIHCRVTCRRCGWHFEWNHDWVGCECRVCGKEQHVWAAGRCRMCGVPCRHPKELMTCSGDTGTSTVSGQFDMVCQQCGMVLREVGRDGLPRASGGGPPSDGLLNHQPGKGTQPCR
jgi:hypothetical protein